MKKFALLFMMMFLLCISIGCRHTGDVKEGEGKDVEEKKTVYTAYNMWYEQPDNLWSINYKVGRMIPAGTKITVVSTRRSKEIKFRTVENDSLKYIIHFTPNYHPGLKITDVKDRLFTAQDFNEITKGFTVKELECVKAGEVRTGIRKKAVLVIYGYPPEHVTTSLKAHKWIYWVSRFKQIEVMFDDNELVSGVK